MEKEEEPFQSHWDILPLEIKQKILWIGQGEDMRRVAEIKKKKKTDIGNSSYYGKSNSYGTNQTVIKDPSRH